MSDKKVYVFSDVVLVQIRELLQLSMITGTPIIEHLRAMRMEEDKDTGKLMLCVEYVEGFNKMVLDLREKALKLQEQWQKKEAEDDSEKN